MKYILILITLLSVGCQPRDSTHVMWEVDVLCRYPGKDDVKERFIADYYIQDDGATKITFLNGKRRLYTGSCVFDTKRVEVKKSKRFEYEAKFNRNN